MADSNSLQKSFRESVFRFLIFQLEDGLIWSDVKVQIPVKYALLSKIQFISMFDDNFDYNPDGISKKERHFLLAVFLQGFWVSNQILKFPISKFWPHSLLTWDMQR